jgi:hypothetical protein
VVERTALARMGLVVSLALRKAVRIRLKTAEKTGFFGENSHILRRFLPVFGFAVELFHRNALRKILIVNILKLSASFGGRQKINRGGGGTLSVDREKRTVVSNSPLLWLSFILLLCAGGW